MKKYRSLFRLLTRLLHPYKYKIIYIVALSTLLIILSLFIPYLNKFIIDEVIIKGNLRALYLIFLLMFIFFILMTIFEIIVSYLFWYLTNKFIYELRIKLLKRILKKEINFFSKIKTGELISRIQSETNDIVALLNNLRILYNQFVYVFIILLIIFNINFKIAS